MSQETKLQVVKWLAEEKIPPRELATPPPDIEWALTAKPAADRTLTIAQAKDFPDRVQVRTGLIIGEEHAKAFAQLEDGARATLLHVLRRDAMLLGVLYHGIREPLARFEFLVHLYASELGKGSFMTAVGRVQNALIQSRGLIRLRLGDLGGGPAGGGQPPDEGIDLGGPFGDFIEGLDLDLDGPERDAP